MKKNKKMNNKSLEQDSASKNQNDEINTTNGTECDPEVTEDNQKKNQDKGDTGYTESKVNPKELESSSEERNGDDNDEGETDGQDPVECLKDEIKEQKDKYIRLMAEFDNYKRRTSKEYERLIELANERLMIDVIEVRESLERALSMKDKKENYTTFLEGIQLIFNKFDEILTKNGLAVFTEIGDEFNPEIHDALMKSPDPEIPEDHIVQIFEKGYTLKTHVIKHAKVIVSSGEQEQDDENESANSSNDSSEKKVSK